MDYLLSSTLLITANSVSLSHLGNYNLYLAALLLNAQFLITVGVTVIVFLKDMFCDGKERKQSKSTSSKGKNDSFRESPGS